MDYSPEENANGVQEATQKEEEKEVKEGKENINDQAGLTGQASEEPVAWTRSVASIRHRFHRNGDTFEIGRIVVDGSRPDTRWSASILPFCTMPDGTYFFLLGKEMNQKNGEWCGFGGRHEDYEHDPVPVAAREWEEELLFCGNPDRLQMQYDLENNQYHARIAVCVNEGAGEEVPRNYLVTYLKQVPWSPDLPALFSQRYQWLFELQQAYYLYESAVKEWMRAEQWQAGTLDEDPCPEATKDAGNGPAEQGEQEPGVGAAGSSTLLPIYGRDCVTWVVNVEDDPVSGERTMHIVTDAFQRYCPFNATYHRCYRYYRNLRDVYTRLPAETRSLPCIRYQVPGCPSIRDAALGLPYVPPSFLEKCEVAWFSNHQLLKLFQGSPLEGRNAFSAPQRYRAPGSQGPSFPPRSKLGKDINIRRNFLCTLYSALEILGCLPPGLLHPARVAEAEARKELARASPIAAADSTPARVPDTFLEHGALGTYRQAEVASSAHVTVAAATGPALGTLSSLAGSKGVGGRSPGSVARGTAGESAVRDGAAAVSLSKSAGQDVAESITGRAP